MKKTHHVDILDQGVLKTVGWIVAADDAMPFLPLCYSIFANGQVVVMLLSMEILYG